MHFTPFCSNQVDPLLLLLVRIHSGAPKRSHSLPGDEPFLEWNDPAKAFNESTCGHLISLMNPRPSISKSSMHPLGALLESIVGNPYELAANFLAKVTKRPQQDVELLLRAVTTKDSLARIALAGLFLESTRPQCKTSLGPVDPMRDPSSGFTIRDISLVPAEPKVAKAHSLPDQPRAQVPSAVPVVIEVVSVGLEARPDLVGVVETALNDLPSESTQIIRAFVAGFRGYQDCPDPSNGNVVLSALLS